MKKLTATTLVSFLLLSSNPVLFATSVGAYAGLGLGVSKIDDFNDALSITNGGFAARVFGGYKFNDYLGLEANYAHLNKQNFVIAEYPWINFDYKLSALSLIGKLYLPLNERFNINFSLGGAQMFTSVDATSIYSNNNHYVDSTNATVLTGGIGAAFSITEHLAAHIDLIAYDEKKGDYSHLAVPGSSLLTAGLSYWF